MNWNQVMGIVRACVPAIVAFVVGKGWLSESSATDVAAAVVTILAAGWSVHSNSDTAAIKTVAAMPDVKAIIATPTPNSSIAAVVADTSQPKVIKETP